MYGGWEINEVELREMLGLSEEEFNSSQIQGELPASDGLTISELRYWRLWKLRDLSFPHNPDWNAVLRTKLIEKYSKKKHRLPLTGRGEPPVDIELFRGLRVNASQLAEMKGMSWTTFRFAVEQIDFPEPDSSQFGGGKRDTVRGGWWWVTTIIRAFPRDLELIDSLGRRYVVGWEDMRPW